MRLVAGLGNPGLQYVGTRHNVGFEILDLLARRHKISAEWREGRASAMEVKWRRGPEDVVVLAKPITFMNLSGQAIGDLCRFYKVAVSDLFVVCDDVNLPLGRLRARSNGTEGGHNGLRSVAEHLGTIDYARLRVGVGRGDLRRDLADHVLARFAPEEMPGIEAAIARAADAIELWVAEGLESVMRTFNRPLEIEER